MSEEVSQMIQIADLSFRIGKDLTIAGAKVISVIYHSKWKGVTSFKRFHAIAGSHTGYLDIQSQEPKALKAFEKRMERNGVLFSRLPDLNTADGRTQCVYNADQVEGVNAALADHNREKLKKLSDIKARYGEGTQAYAQAKVQLEAAMPDIRPTTADAYAQTRTGPDGRETGEYTAIKNSAIKETGKKQRHEPSLTQEKKEKLKESVKSATQDELVKRGEAVEISLKSAEKVTVRNAAGKAEEVWRMRLPGGKYSLLLGKNDVAKNGLAVIKKSGVYNLIDNKSGKVAKEVGSKVLSMVYAPSAAKEAAKAAVRVAKDVAEIGKGIGDTMASVLDKDKSRGGR